MNETKAHSHLWLGVPLVMGSAALFGATPPFSKFMLEAVSPFMLAGLLYLGAGVGLGTYKCVMGRTSGTDEASLTAKDIPWLALTVALGGVVGPVCLRSYAKSDMVHLHEFNLV